jgi:hypothetical protein
VRKFRWQAYCSAGRNANDEAISRRLAMGKLSREQRFDMRVLAVVALLLMITAIIMLTVASDIFWTAVG